MKRHGNLFEKIVAFDNLELAYRKTIRGKRERPASLRFYANLEENLIQLQNELIWGMYTPRPYRTFVVFEPKVRTIYAASFRDRVVHHAIMNVLEPIWSEMFISDSYACRLDKGTHAGVERLTGMLRSAASKWDGVYCLKGDVSKFFPSINHHVLMAIVRRKIKCARTLALLETIVFAGGDPSDPDSHNLPIGNLISQWGANLYLNELDRFVKHVLRAEYYVRYMDDFVILHHDKGVLWQWLERIETLLNVELKLSLNAKTGIFPVSQGIDFLGYRIWPHKRLLRKSSSRRMLRRLKALSNAFKHGEIGLDRIAASVKSWLAHCAHCNSWRIRSRVLSSVLFTKER